MKMFVALIALIFLCGCQSPKAALDAAGQTFEQAKQAASGLRIGMKPEEVRMLLGAPDEKGVSDSGETWVYQWNQRPFRQLRVVFDDTVPVEVWAAGIHLPPRLKSWEWSDY
jgi:outer membrane protein assembly factor BamE (lipoprotein component of BamABCDE complex)